MEVKSRDINLQGIETLEMADGSIKKITPEMRIAAQETFNATGGFGGGSSLGTFSTKAELEAAFPAANNSGLSGIVGTFTYKSDGISYLRDDTTDISTVSQYYAGLPLHDVGPSFIYKNVMPVRRISNGTQIRYIPDSGFALYPEILNDGIVDDSVTTLQPLAQFTVPGGAILHNDRARLIFSLLCTDNTNTAVGFGSTSAKAYIRLIGLGQNSSLSTFTWPAASTSSTSIVVDVAMQAFVTNQISFTGTSLSATSDTGTKKLNLLSDFIIEIGYQHSGASTGRYIALSSYRSDRSRVEFFPCVKNFSVSTVKRDPIKFPFTSDAIWNIPLPPSATYASSSDAQTMAITGGDNYGGLSGSTFNYIQGKTGIAFTPYQTLDTDPWLRLEYTQRQFSGAPWPYPYNNSNNYGPDYIYIKLPRAQLPVGQAGDNIATFVSPCKRFLYEAGNMVWHASLDKHTCGSIALTDLLGHGRTLRNTEAYNTTELNNGSAAYQEAYRASGLAMYGGLIRGADLAAGAINHMVGIQLSTAQHMCSYFTVVTQTGTLFEIVPYTSGYTQLDYSSLFTAGTTVYHGGLTYTVAADATWSSITNRTSFNVTVAITSSSAALTLGGIANSPGIKSRQFVWPSTTCDSGSASPGNATFYNGIVPLGTVFAIPQSVNLNTLGLTPGGLILATAFQKYGGIDTDTTIGTFGLCMVDLDAQQNYMSILNDFSTDKNIIRSNLRRVTNYNRNLVRAGILNKTTKPPALNSIY